MSSRLQREVDQIVREAQAKNETEHTEFGKKYEQIKKHEQYIDFYGFILYVIVYSVILEIYGIAYFASGFTSQEKADSIALINSDMFFLALHGMSLVMAVWAYKYIKGVNGVSSLEPVYKFPLDFWEETGLILCLVVLTFIFTSPLVLLVVHVLLIGTSCVFFSIFEIRHISFQKWEKEDSAFHQKIQSVLDTATEDDLEELKEVKRCQICEIESKYDLCLECETKYRGERHRLRAQILRAKQSNVEATLTLKEWLDILNTFNWRCAYCHGEFHALEHYVPIIQGGGTTAENCLPACTACNSKKSGNHPDFELEDLHQPRPFQTKTSASVKRTNHTPKKS